MLNEQKVDLAKYRLDKAKEQVDNALVFYNAVAEYISKQV